MELGSTLRYLRKQRKIRQNQLAKQIGISQNALSLIETNQTFPQQGTLKKICEALGLPITYVMLCAISAAEVKPEFKSSFNALIMAAKNLLVPNG